MKFRVLIPTMVVLIAGCFILSGFVRNDGASVFIIDQTGKHWDITQAVSIGFKPEKFQYGIGMNAFTPLDDSHVAPKPFQMKGSHRVIGIFEGGQAHAYSVGRLHYHEIANTHIGGRPIAVGY